MFNKKFWIKWFVLSFVLQSSLGVWANLGGTKLLDKVAKSVGVEKPVANQRIPASPKNIAAGKCTAEMEMNGVIGPANQDFITRAIEKTVEQKCESLLVLIDTPGGSLPATRKIVQSILNSPIPVLCLIYPRGAHAGSAGAIIMQACHVSGAMVATNMGAATPVSGQGQEIPKDLRKKMINDTVSWMEGVTKLRKRNLKFSEEIITEAKAVSAKEALKLGAIDYVAETKESFLEFAHGRTVSLSEATKTVVQVGPVVQIPSDYREQILKLVADPQTAYMIFMGSLGLLYYEITHPGMIVPGVVGAIGLVFALVSLDKLNVDWAGVVLILLGLAFLVGEVFTPSFGFLGAGGIVSFVVGSVLLFDEAKTGYSLPASVIATTVIPLGIVTLTIAYFAYKIHNLKARGSSEEMIGKTGTVKSIKGDGKKGKVMVMGELWKVKSDVALLVDQEIEVLSLEGLTLHVRPRSQES